MTHYVIFALIRRSIFSCSCLCFIERSRPSILTHNSSLVNLIIWNKFVLKGISFITICSRTWIILHTYPIWFISIYFRIKWNQLSFSKFWFRIIWIMTVVHGWINTFCCLLYDVCWACIPMICSFVISVIRSRSNTILVVSVMNPVSWISCS